MYPPIGLLTPVKIGLSHWLGRFYTDHFQGDTPANVEWAARGSSKAMVWAPGRMVDEVESMISAWANNKNSGKTGTSAFLPVLFAAMANEFIEAPSEEGRPVVEPVPFTFPADTFKREFRLTLMTGDLRTQIAVVASEQMSALSIVGQLLMWCQRRMTFPCTYRFAGFDSDWTTRVMNIERQAVASPLGDQLVILTMDLTLRFTAPIFHAPPGGDPLNPNGYDTTQTVDFHPHPLGVGLTGAPGVVLYPIQEARNLS